MFHEITSWDIHALFAQLQLPILKLTVCDHSAINVAFHVIVYASHDHHTLIQSLNHHSKSLATFHV
jgi:hypothetical protein